MYQAQFRLLAALVLGVTTVSGFEPVIGTLRDAQVHHESVMAAGQHAGAAAGDHGHEDPGAGGDHEHGREHEHGAAADHCTHSHGIGPTSSLDLTFTATITQQRSTDSVKRVDRSLETLRHPPKA